MEEITKSINKLADAQRMAALAHVYASAYTSHPMSIAKSQAADAVEAFVNALANLENKI